MWQQKPDFAHHKEKYDGEGWLVNKDERVLIRIKPDKPTQHGQFVLVSTFRLQKNLGNPIREQRMLRELEIEMWLELQKVGWARFK